MAIGYSVRTVSSGALQTFLFPQLLPPNPALNRGSNDSSAHNSSQSPMGLYCNYGTCCFYIASDFLLEAAATVAHANENKSSSDV